MLVCSASAWVLPTAIEWRGIETVPFLVIAAVAFSCACAAAVVWFEAQQDAGTSHTPPTDAAPVHDQNTSTLSASDTSAAASISKVATTSAASKEINNLASATVAWRDIVARAHASAPALDPARRSAAQALLSIWRQLQLQPHSFRLFMVQVFVSYAAIYSTVFYVAGFIAARHAISESAASSVSIGLLNLLAIAVSPAQGWLFDRRGRRLTMFIGTFALAFVAIVLVACTRAHPAWFAVLFVGAFTTVRTASISTLRCGEAAALRRGEMIDIIEWHSRIAMIADNHSRLTKMANKSNRNSGRA
jgi:hypothetical protein